MLVVATASGFPSLIWFNLSYTVFCICDNSWTSVEQLRKNSCRLNICLHGSSDCGRNAAWSPEMLAGLHYSQRFCLWFVILTKQMILLYICFPTLCFYITFSYVIWHWECLIASCLFGKGWVNDCPFLYIELGKLSRIIHFDKYTWCDTTICIKIPC